MLSNYPQNTDKKNLRMRQLKSHHWHLTKAITALYTWFKNEKKWHCAKRVYIFILVILTKTVLTNMVLKFITSHKNTGIHQINFKETKLILDETDQFLRNCT